MSTDRDGAFGDDPIGWFLHAQALAAQTETFDVTRAALATASIDGVPAVRFVLVKVVDARGFVVFTNLESDKARDLDANPHAALAFHWHSVGTQVRVRGPVRRIDAAEADGYFATRPRMSQLGAWASRQSRPIDHRSLLDAQLAAAEAKFPGEVVVPRPAQWGGFRIAPETIEFWQDRHGRLHDRWRFECTADGWQCVRLQP